MKHTLICHLALLLALVCGGGTQVRAAEPVGKPNIIFFLFDDLGWGQPPGYNPQSKLRTPNLDKLVSQGMRFTDAHTAAAVCTPTRYGVLTGRHPSRIGQFGVLGTWSEPIIPASRPTVASLLKQQGYDTACIGKWHLGLQWEGTNQKGPPPIGSRFTNGPTQLGFDYFCGYTHSANIRTVLQQDRVIADVKMDQNQPMLLRKAVEWLEKRDPQKPFFLYLPVCPPHYPVAPAAEFIGKSGGVDEAGKDLKGEAHPGRYPDWLFQGDAMLGEIMGVLETRGLADNTLLIATSDNGAEHRAYPPLRESKRSIHEGGHRVPFVARWPGKVKPGTTWNHPICLNDLMATTAEVTGATLPPDAGEDSVSILPALLGRTTAPTREATVHQSASGDLAIRQGPWKLIFKKNGSRELYNLEADLSETKDVFATNPGVVTQLATLMQRYIDNGRSTPGVAQKNNFKISINGGKGKRQNKGPKAEAGRARELPWKADPAKPGKPNILWLIAEDIGPEALGSSGAPQATTPNLDRLAEEGVRYTRAYAGMVCSVSRSSFMTGMYSTTIGTHNHRSHRDDGYQLPAGVRVLTDWLRDAGYFTANIRRLPDALGFNGTGKTDWNFTYAGKPFDSADWADLKAHQPFYAQINFDETHRGFHSPAKADPAKVALPQYYPDHPVSRKDWAAYLDAATELDRKAGLVLKQLEADGLADNTIVVFFGDNGQAMARGKQFCYEEGLHVPMIIRWPKNFPTPPQIKPGALEQGFVNAMDLAPTMLDIAGVEKPAKMQGRIFLGARAEAAPEYTFGSRDRCDETVMRIRTVRDAKYRYIRNFTPETPFLATNHYKETQYPVWNLLKQLHTEGKLTPEQDFLCQPRMPDEELYDLDADPHEIHNLAKSAKTEDQVALKKLRAALEKWIVDTDDKGRQLEQDAVIDIHPAANDHRAGKAIAGQPDRSNVKQQQSRTIAGWTVNINPVLLDDTNAGMTEHAFVLLKAQLEEILRVVPPAAVAELQKVPLWFSPEYPGIPPRAEFHPDAGWLRGHGRDPLMAKGVEFTNIRIFDAETRRMPNFALHELAHAYHDRFLQDGFQNADIKASYEQAKAGGKYDRVERQDAEGRKHMDRAYALTNPQEYFAETTEAYFSRNDFFPYNRDQLKEMDPGMHSLLEKLWGMGTNPAATGRKDPPRPQR